MVKQLFIKKSLPIHTNNNSQDNSLNTNKGKIKKLIRRKNPNIFIFTKNDSFIYEPRCSNYFYRPLSNKNEIKPSKEELEYLDSIIEKLSKKSNEPQFYVLPFFKDLMDNVRQLQPKKDERANLIEQIIQNLEKDSNISLQKIENEYQKIALLKGIKPIKKSTIHKILKNVLGYRYRKTSVKNNKLLEQYSIKYCFFFLKIIWRCLKLGINIIYIDECGFFTQNSNYYSWRKFSQEKYHKIKDNKKFNLIMAVSSNTINHFKINDSSTTSLEFKEFMKELISKLTAYEKSNSLFVFDNLTSHLTDEMFQFYYENKLKVLLNAPY